MSKIQKIKKRFVQNKYSRAYFRLVKKARQEERRKNAGVYYESHHILPKCMEGTDGQHNRVLLTAKEHYVAHILLTYMTESKKYRKMMHHGIPALRARTPGSEQFKLERRGI